MDLGLDGKKIVVTGAAGGIGKNIFMSLIKEGAIPIGVDIKPLRESELIDEWDYVKGLYFCKDITNYSAMEELFQKIGKSVDGLVNNAALLGGDSQHGGRTSEAWDKIIGTNAKAAYMLIELLAPGMKKGSSIVNIGSTALDIIEKEAVLYTAAKGALFALTKSYAVQLAPDVRVNMVSPGNVSSKQNKEFYVTHPEMLKKIESKTLLGRSVEPQEVADLVLLLLSDKTRAITGEVYPISCGMGLSLFEDVEVE